MSNKKIQLQDRVVYNGSCGDEKVIGTVVDAREDEFYVKFDNSQQDGEEPIVEDDWFSAEDLKRHDDTKTVETKTRFNFIDETRGIRKNGKVVPISEELLKERARMENPSKSAQIAEDYNGSPIRIGDFVVPVNITWLQHMSQECLGVPMLVVHRAKSYLNPYFLYLLAESRFNPKTCLNSQTYGYNTLSQTDKDRINRFFPNEPNDCERLEFVKIPKPKAGNTKLTTGQKVTLATDRNPTYLRGLVYTTSVGTVTAVLSNSLVKVDFPKHKGWFGHPDDLTLADA